MTPEEQHADAAEAAREWRDEERERKAESGQDYWIDSGSGPGYERPALRPKLRPDRDKLS